MPSKGKGKINWMPWLIIGLLAAYIISPIDLIPDVIPVVGWLDDLFAALLIVRELMVLTKGG